MFAGFAEPLQDQGAVADHEPQEFLKVPQQLLRGRCVAAVALQLRNEQLLSGDPPGGFLNMSVRLS